MFATTECFLAQDKKFHVKWKPRTSIIWPLKTSVKKEIKNIFEFYSFILQSPVWFMCKSIRLIGKKKAVIEPTSSAC